MIYILFYICYILFIYIFKYPLLMFFQHTLAGWRKVFWVAAMINIGGALIYTIFGTGKVQSWAITEEDREEEEKEERDRSINS